MTTAKRFASLLALTLLALVINLQAQTPAGQASQGQDGVEQGKASAEAVEPPPPLAVGPISGEGTSGKISKFTGANSIGNSIITENTGRIGINITPPTARLHVNAATPAPLANNGTAAIPLLQTSGGKGGKTTALGKHGGQGANILLMAGNGGDAGAGAINGQGGSITLQPGLPGAGALLALRAASF